jgi:hypothetical protein
LFFVGIMTVQELLNAAEAGGLRMVRWPVFIGSMTFLLPLVLKLTSDVIELDAWNGAAAALALSSELGRTVMIADIGTNGELVLAYAGRLFCAATAAGPAFEGGGIACGMPGMPGAVSGVSFENEEIKTETIGGGEQLGICGSGLIDALAAMLECGAMDESGRLCEKSKFVKRLENGKLAFNLSGGVYIEEGDVRSLQLAKAAVAAGMETLLDEAGISAAEVETLYIAGGCGKGGGRAHKGQDDKYRYDCPLKIYGALHRANDVLGGYLWN